MSGYDLNKAPGFKRSENERRAERCVTHHHACDCREAWFASEIARLRERVRVLERFCKEVLWLRAFEHDLREVIGYTNWNALMEKATDAAKAMEEQP